jgi:hypothetical protein
MTMTMAMFVTRMTMTMTAMVIVVMTMAVTVERPDRRLVQTRGEPLNQAISGNTVLDTKKRTESRERRKWCQIH